MPGSSSLQALIFDMDGTLADTEAHGHRVAFNAAFRDFGLDWDWDLATYGTLLSVAGGKERIALYLSRYRPDFRHPDLPGFIAALHQAKTRHFQRLLEAGEIPLRPGVARLIAETRGAGFRLAIATTAALEGVVTLLETALGSDSPSWFDAIGAGDVVPRKKPAPDIYLWVLERMKLRAEACLAIEDSGPGLRAASGAGLATIITVSDYTREQDFSGATLVLSDLGEPDVPFRVLRGDAAEFDFVSVEALRAWHGREMLQRGQSKL